MFSVAFSLFWSSQQPISQKAERHPTKTRRVRFRIKATAKMQEQPQQQPSVNQPNEEPHSLVLFGVFHEESVFDCRRSGDDQSMGHYPAHPHRVCVFAFRFLHLYSYSMRDRLGALPFQPLTSADFGGSQLKKVDASYHVGVVTRRFRRPKVAAPGSSSLSPSHPLSVAFVFFAFSCCFFLGLFCCFFLGCCLLRIDP